MQNNYKSLRFITVCSQKSNKNGKNDENEETFEGVK